MCDLDDAPDGDGQHIAQIAAFTSSWTGQAVDDTHAMR
jgi:hypothetical protein